MIKDDSPIVELIFNLIINFLLLIKECPFRIDSRGKAEL